MSKNSLIMKATINSIFKKKKEKRKSDLYTDSDLYTVDDSVLTMFQTEIKIMDIVAKVLPAGTGVSLKEKGDTIIFKCRNLSASDFLAYLDTLYKISDKYQGHFKCFWILEHDEEEDIKEFLKIL